MGTSRDNDRDDDAAVAERTMAAVRKMWLAQRRAPARSSNLGPYYATLRAGVPRTPRQPLSHLTHVVNIGPYFDALRASVPGMRPRRLLPRAIEFIRQSRLRSKPSSTLKFTPLSRPKPSAPRRAL